MEQDPENLQQLLDRIDTAHSEHEKVSLGAIIEAVGSRSFGPLLVMAGVITVSPLSGIPGMPTTMGVLTLLIASQLLLGSGQFWLPSWLTSRSVGRDKIDTALKFLRPPARFIDRGLKPRLEIVVGRAGTTCIALVCAILALSMPPMEVIPLTVNGVGIVLLLFGLALIARDGVLAIGAFSLTVFLITVVINQLFG